MIISWNSRDVDQCAAAKIAREQHAVIAPNWKTVCDVPGLTVYILLPLERGVQLVTLHGTVGVILGTMFESGDSLYDGASNLITAISVPNTERLISTRGRSLIGSVWGSYILALRNPSTGHVYILRGPMSQLRCHFAKFKGVTLAFSSAHDLAALGLVELTINWDCIVAHAARADHLSQETGLGAITSLDGGECMEVCGSGLKRHVYWAPKHIACQAAIEDFDYAAKVLRARLDNSVNSLASLHDSIIHTLSGGLDSSIILGCLARTPNPPQICAVNHYSTGIGDERDYARSMAMMYQVELVERGRDHNVDLRMFTRCTHSERPILHLTACDAELHNSELATERRATAIFDGELGDAAFGNSLWLEAMLEYIWRHGWTPGLFGTAIDYAQHRRQSIWRTLYETLRRRAATGSQSYWSIYNRMLAKQGRSIFEQFFISADCLDKYEQSIERFIHPWLKDIDGVPPGLFNLIAALVVTNATLGNSPFRTAEATSVSPIASQPVVETCLNIASYLHIRHGQNRSVARAAFADRLSPLVLHRGAGKGAPSLWMQQLVARNRSFLREYLMDGTLVRRGILDRRKIEATLAPTIQVNTAPCNDIMPKIYIESWVRHWELMIANDSHADGRNQRRVAV